MTIQHRDELVNGVFFIEHESKRTAEMTYQYRDQHTIVVDHTWVDDSLRGQGVAKRLFDALVTFAQDKQLKVIPICSYVVTMFERHPELQSLRA
ncbi:MULTISPECIES: GNAT family N-acetyltransferase [unclassified Acinetobacter]|uniref:GNAT family N-acetyltransferase n=1 Tax=unclassified Acinetobacter TaxID=196816 RepID=UPI0035B88FB6